VANSIYTIAVAPNDGFSHSPESSGLKPTGFQPRAGGSGASFRILLENGSGYIQLENGSGDIELEDGP